MATSFHSTSGLIETLESMRFDRPPALVCNAHITGCSVGRALAAQDVPVIAVDRNGDGVGPYSEAVVAAGAVTFPLEDTNGFVHDVERIAAVLEYDPVIFPCMDEWVHALVEGAPAGVRLPFADREVIEGVLDKESLYSLADALEIPYPETYRLSEYDPETIMDRLECPFVVKPARKREFEELIGTNVIEIEDTDSFFDIVERARAADVRIMAQEKVPIATGHDRSFASYRSPVGDVIGLVGNAHVRYPQAYGTSCVVDTVEDSKLEARAKSILEAAEYYGISESEFVYDSQREKYVLLDVNTRPWKWISLPVEAGINLPYAAYADAVGESYAVGPICDSRWVYLPDYIQKLSSSPGVDDVLSSAAWRSFLSGDFEQQRGLTTGVYRPSDPGPALQLLETLFGRSEYYCSC
ncbi:carboxylate--amine ligase [Natrialbaceae archaeon A-CW2]|uniref:carboxylate--amine ligase n=1 Tax=Natronosalvus amylolyticus TaxID=2961994 RepID=UPI0020C95822|nr:carboxylate--amine ligase [Natronosalvus amylolyticus]